MTTTVTKIAAAEQQTRQGGPDLAWLAAEAGNVGQAAAPRPIYEFSKRALDLNLALVALAVRFSSRGAILFRQTRVGRYGRPFTCLKFRTMVKHAERMLAEDPELAAKYVTAYKLRQDCRVTRIGRILRKTSLDELPQLLNVIRGDMSLVGPRPVPADELRTKYGPAASQVISVRPGLTGLWQVSGRGATSYQERVQLDVSYLERRSLLLDLWIIARTPIALLTMRGAH